MESTDGDSVLDALVADAQPAELASRDIAVLATSHRGDVEVFGRYGFPG
jgi:hypothetical protein